MTAIALVIFVIPALIIALCSIIIVCIIWSKSRPPRPRYQSMDQSSTGALRLPTRDRNACTDVTARASSAGVIPRSKIRTVKMTFGIVLGNTSRSYNSQGLATSKGNKKNTAIALVHARPTNRMLNSCENNGFRL